MVGRVSAKPFSDSAKHGMFFTKDTLTEMKSPLESSVSKLFWKKASVAYSLISCSHLFTSNWRAHHDVAVRRWC